MKVIVGLLLLVLIAATPAALRAQDMELVGSTMWSGSNYTVARGSYLYCSYDAGLVILDVSDPEQPVFTSKLYLPGDGKHLALSGDYVYFVDDHIGLYIIDISDPTSPEIAGLYQAYHLEDVYIDGQYAYVVGAIYFDILDISDPAEPVVVYHYYENGLDFTSVYVQGDYAYMSSTEIFGPLKIYDVSDRANPVLVGTYDEMEFALDVGVNGDYAYLTVYGSMNRDLLAIDISDRTNPIRVGQYDSGGIASEISIVDNKAYLAIGPAGGFDILNLNNPASPSLISRYRNGSFGVDVFVDGDIVYLVDGPYEIQVVDISGNPSQLGEYDTPYSGHGITVQSDYAYVASGMDGLRIYNYGDPSNAQPVGHFQTPESARLVYLRSNLAFLIIFNHLVQIIDIFNAANPEEVGEFTVPGTARDIAFYDDYALVVDGEMQVVNIADPESTETVENFHTPGYAYGIEVSGDFAYIADGYDGGLIKVDISDPLNPAIVAGYDTRGRGSDVALSGNYAYLADDTSGVQIFDISDSDTLHLVGNIQGNIDLVSVYENFLYLSPSGVGINVYDISDPVNPELIMRYPHSSTAGYFGDDKYVFLSRGSSQLILSMEQTDIDIDSQMPEDFDIALNYPNPFNARTAISFSLPESGPVRIDIYSILGQRVAAVCDQFMLAGKHQIIWDSQDFASGIYLARLVSTGSSQSLKMTLLK